MAATHRLMVIVHRDSFSQMLLCSSDEGEDSCEAVETIAPELAIALLGEPTEIPPCSYAKHFSGLPGFDDWRGNHEEFELFSSPVGVIRLELTNDGVEGVFEKSENGDAMLSLKLVKGVLEYHLDSIRLRKADVNLRAMVLVPLELLPSGRWKPLGTPEVVTPENERWPELITRSLRTL